MARFSMLAERPTWLARALSIALAALCAELVSSQPNIDGGRGDLPGMKKDMFDEVNRAKKGGGQQNRMGKGPPDCPKSDKMSPFYNIAFTDGEMFVRLDSAEGPCIKVLSIGGNAAARLADPTLEVVKSANYTEMRNASLTCGPAGEWKKRIAEEMSMVFFQGGYEWVKSENGTMEVETEAGTFTTEVNEAKFAAMMECWKQACGCEQAKNPKMKIILFSLLVAALLGLSYDSISVAMDSLRGKKPPKHVECKKGHRLIEVAPAYSHICDICRKTGTAYQCQVSCNFDMCKVCYKAAKKKTRATFKTWLEKHPDDEDNKKKSKDDDDEDDAKKDASGSEAGDKKESGKEASEAESGAEGSEAKSGDKSEEEKSKSEKSEEEKDEK